MPPLIGLTAAPAAAVQRSAAPAPGTDRPGAVPPATPPTVAPGPDTEAVDVSGITAPWLRMPRSEEPDPSAEAPAPEAGSSGPLATAVANALAARARAAVSPSVRGDARDRLLAALLTDPVRALGAAAELEGVRGQIDRLAEALSHERAVLAQVLHRLAGAGLDDAQIARLANLPAAEVRALLDTSQTG